MFTPPLAIPAAQGSSQRQRQRQRVRMARLLAGLLRACGDAFGAAVHPPHQRAERRQLVLDVFAAVDGYVDDTAMRSIDALVAQLAECYLPVEAAAPAEQLLAGEIENLATSAQLMFAGALPVLAEFYLDVASDLVNAADEALLRGLRLLSAGIDAAAASWRDASAVAEGLLDSATWTADQLARRLDEIGRGLTFEPDKVRAESRKALARLLLGLPAQADVPDILPLGVQVALTAFDVAFPDLFWMLVTDGLQVALGGTRQLEQAVRSAAETAEGIDNLRAAVDAIIENRREGFVQVDHLHEAIRHAVGLEALADTIAAAIEDARREVDARTLERRVRTIVALADATVDITSPVSAAGHNAPGVYPSPVPFIVEVRGPGADAVLDPELSTTILLINGTEQILPPAAWRRIQRGVALTRELRTSNGLRPGVNALEFTLALANGAPRRQLQLFIFDPLAGTIDGQFEIVNEDTVIDTPGDDHEHVDDEKVTLRWLGSEELSLAGWRLTDQWARHTFRFPDVTVRPGRAFTVTTGGNRGQDGLHFWWGRTRAVWNNRGDKVRLLDPNDVLRFEQRVRG
jgi:hypothetical protein